MSIETTACESLPVNPKTAQGRAIGDEFLTGHDEVEIPDGPALHPLAEPSAFPTVVQIVNGIVTPNLRVLLASVLGAIDASIPNKDQNKAVKHIMRKAFDDAYCNILERSYPDTNFGFNSEYNLEPEPNRAKAYAEGFLKLE
jgi:hypothetical protein